MRDKVVLITSVKGAFGTYGNQTFLAAKAKVVGVSRSIKQTDFDAELAVVPGTLSRDGVSYSIRFTGISHR